MTNTPPHQPHVPSDNANKTADALRDVPVALRRRIQPPPSRNEVVFGLNDSFHSLDRASDQTHQESPHQRRSTPKNTNKTTDALGDETASKCGQIQPPPPPKEAVMVPNLPASPNPSSLPREPPNPSHNNTTSSATRPASNNGNRAANQQENNVSSFFSC